MQINASIFGLNYVGTENELSGCVNDANFYDDLFNRSEEVDEWEICVNDECNKVDMVRSIEETCDKTEDGGVVYITYSGHGTTVPPGIQSWVPNDFDWNNPKTWLTYDELDHILLAHEKRGVLAVVISDSCHSQADPRSHFRDIKNPHKVKNRFLQPPPEIIKRLVSDPFGRNVLTADQDDLLLAGCHKDQTSADAYIDDDYHGAFTYAMELALHDAHANNKRPWPSYQAVMLKARSWLASNGYDQVCSGNGAPNILQLPFFSPLASTVKKQRRLNTR